MKRFDRVVSQVAVFGVAWCILVASPPYIHWPWFCRLLPWGALFPGRGWTP